MTLASTETVTWRDFSAAFWLLAISVIGSFLLMMLSTPKTGFAAVVAPPGSSFAETVSMIAAADGQIVRTGGFDNVIIAQFDQENYVIKLKNAGVWFVTDPLALGGCSGPSTQQTRSAPGV